MQTTANLWEVLCRDLESEKQSAKAEEYQEIARKFLATARQVFPADSSRLGDAIEIAGDVCQAAGQHAEAQANFSEALQSAPPISAARLTAKIALLHDRMGETAAARKDYEKAVALSDQVRDPALRVMLLSQWGALCKREGDLAGAETHYRDALEFTTRRFGAMDPETAIAANNLGVLCIDQGAYVEAENLHMQALSIREKTFGALHPEVARSMGNLAVVYHAMGTHEKARGFYAGALKIYERFSAADDPEVQAVRANLESLPVPKARA
jgi:tetratricopeptide (TPR) repeat protein